MGGSSNETQANGDGTARLVKTRTTWKISGLQLAIDWSAQDMEFLQSIADGNDDIAIAATLADGSVLNGTGQIQGDIVGSSQSSTVALELAGPGKLTQ